MIRVERGTKLNPQADCEGMSPRLGLRDQSRSTGPM